MIMTRVKLLSLMYKLIAKLSYCQPRIIRKSLFIQLLISNSLLLSVWVEKSITFDFTYKNSHLHKCIFTSFYGKL